MSGANQQLVDEANLVSREMMDVAITWHEYWFQGLEDAANMYFTDKVRTKRTADDNNSDRRHFFLTSDITTRITTHLLLNGLRTRRGC
jgi:hypothetical protein